MTATSIEWADDVWNPTTGCDRVSAGCDHCYAAPLARRWKAAGSPKYQRDGDPRTSGPGFGLTEHPGVLAAPLGWRRPRRIFVNSMSDLFHPRVTDAFLEQVFAVMQEASWHTFLVLTKRPSRLRAYARARAERDVGLPGNAWIGVSVEDQAAAERRIPILVDAPGVAVRWISAEPLLGPLDVTAYLRPVPGCGHVDGTCVHPGRATPECHAGVPCPLSADYGGLDWIVVGGESGPGARPMHAGWARSLRDHQAAATGTPLFFKQAGTVLAREWGCASRKGSVPAEWPEPFPQEFPAPAHPAAPGTRPDGNGTTSRPNIHPARTTR